jgi:hypothetical protein
MQVWQHHVIPIRFHHHRGFQIVFCCAVTACAFGQEAGWSPAGKFRRSLTNETPRNRFRPRLSTFPEHKKQLNVNNSLHVATIISWQDRVCAVKLDAPAGNQGSDGPAIAGDPATGEVSAGRAWNCRFFGSIQVVSPSAGACCRPFDPGKWAWQTRHVPATHRDGPLPAPARRCQVGPSGNGRRRRLGFGARPDT